MQASHNPLNPYQLEPSSLRVHPDYNQPDGPGIIALNPTKSQSTPEHMCFCVHGPTFFEGSTAVGDMPLGGEVGELVPIQATTQQLTDFLNVKNSKVRTAEWTQFPIDCLEDLLEISHYLQFEIIKADVIDCIEKRGLPDTQVITLAQKYSIDRDTFLPAILRELLRRPLESLSNAEIDFPPPHVYRTIATHASAVQTARFRMAITFPDTLAAAEHCNWHQSCISCMKEMWVAVVPAALMNRTTPHRMADIPNLLQEAINSDMGFFACCDASFVERLRNSPALLVEERIIERAIRKLLG